jgi:poly(A) polymerase
LTGGTLRDLLLGLAPPDLDITVNGDALGLGENLARQLEGRYIPLDPDHATCRVVWCGFQLDITGLRSTSIEKDLQLRDFTVNALAWELGGFLDRQGEIIDPTGGRADLEARRLRLAGSQVLSADPLRVLRAFRFQSTHDLRPTGQTIKQLAEAAPNLALMPKERISHEWLLLMVGEEAAAAVRGMEDTGVLRALAPALEKGRGVGQNPYHHLDVLEHSLACVDSLQLLIKRPQEWLGPLAGEVDIYVSDQRRRALLMTAALFHDLGKPATRQERELGWATFYRHDTKGADMARLSCLDLGLSKADAEYVARMVAGHMRPFHLLGAQRRGQLTDRAVRRLLEATAGDLIGLFLVALADTLAGKGPLRPLDAEERLVDLLGEVCQMRDERLAQALAAPPLLKGRRLMSELGLEPGPEIGRLLKAVREAQLDGKVDSPEAALRLARQLNQQRPRG